MRTGVVFACLLSLAAAAPAENLSERDSGSMIVSVTEANGLQKRVEGGVSSLLISLLTAGRYTY